MATSVCGGIGAWLAGHEPTYESSINLQLHTLFSPCVFKGAVAASIWFDWAAAAKHYTAAGHTDALKQSLCLTLLVATQQSFFAASFPSCCR